MKGGLVEVGVTIGLPDLKKKVVLTAYSHYSEEPAEIGGNVVSLNELKPVMAVHQQKITLMKWLMVGVAVT